MRAWSAPFGLLQGLIGTGYNWLQCCNQCVRESRSVAACVCSVKDHVKKEALSWHNQLQRSYKCWWHGHALGAWPAPSRGMQGLDDTRHDKLQRSNQRLWERRPVIACTCSLEGYVQGEGSAQHDQLQRCYQCL